MLSEAIPWAPDFVEAQGIELITAGVHRWFAKNGNWWYVGSQDKDTGVYWVTYVGRDVPVAAMQEPNWHPSQGGDPPWQEPYKLS